MRKLLQSGWALALLLLAAPLFAKDTFTWNTNLDSVSADLQGRDLNALLRDVAAATGWRVYLEPGTTHSSSVKFRDLPPGEALRLLLGDLNFALVPQTNGAPRLYVFRTSRDNATQLVRAPADEATAHRHSPRAIPNELIIRVKPGTNIDDLARALGARVTGRIDSLNAYRLQFTDAAAADAARQALAGNPDVLGVDSNYVVDPPPDVMKLASGGLPPVQLKLNPPDASGKVIIGLVDTAVQPLGNDLDKFLLKSLSVAGDATPDPNTPSHGTSMFENMLRSISTVSGGSSSVQVVSVDVYGPNPTSSTFDVAKGIVLAANNGANIINLSLGSTGASPFLEPLIQQLHQNGDLVIAAAGNDGSPELYYPAAYPGVIAVTAAARPGQLAGYANYGPFVDLIAPGSGVVYYNNSAYLVSGTSASAAFISGLAAGIADAKGVSVTTAGTAVHDNPAFQFHPPQ
jgi:hypothetical protein